MNNNFVQQDVFPPAPVVSSKNQSSTSYNQVASSNQVPPPDLGPAPANSMGSAFGSYY